MLPVFETFDYILDFLDFSLSLNDHQWVIWTVKHGIKQRNISGQWYFKPSNWNQTALISKKKTHKFTNEQTSTLVNTEF